MSLNAVKILEISITNSSKEVILEEIQKYLDNSGKKSQKSLKIYTPNTEQLVLAYKNSAFRRVLNQADIAIPDTGGVVWAGHILTKNGPERPIPGIEFMENLIAMAAKRHVPVALIGGRKTLAVETLDCLRKKYPELTGWGEDGPEVRIQNAKLTIQNENEKKYFERLGKKLVATKTVIVFIGLGPPKQEFFIEALSRQLTKNPIILMAVGGSFDILSGRMKRAPVSLRRLPIPFFMGKIGSEWLWRLFLQPWRIFRQIALIEFVWMVVREKLRPRR